MRIGHLAESCCFLRFLIHLNRDQMQTRIAATFILTLSLIFAVSETHNSKCVAADGDNEKWMNEVRWQSAIDVAKDCDIEYLAAIITDAQLYSLQISNWGHHISSNETTVQKDWLYKTILLKDAFADRRAQADGMPDKLAALKFSELKIDINSNKNTGFLQGRVYEVVVLARGMQLAMACFATFPKAEHEQYFSIAANETKERKNETIVRVLEQCVKDLEEFYDKYVKGVVAQKGIEERFPIASLTMRWLRLPRYLWTPWTLRAEAGGSRDGVRADNRHDAVFPYDPGVRPVFFNDEAFCWQCKGWLRMQVAIAQNNRSHHYNNFASPHILMSGAVRSRALAERVIEAHLKFHDLYKRLLQSRDQVIASYFNVSRLDINRDRRVDSNEVVVAWRQFDHEFPLAYFQKQSEEIDRLIALANKDELHEADIVNASCSPLGSDMYCCFFMASVDDVTAATSASDELASVDPEAYIPPSSIAGHDIRMRLYNSFSDYLNARGTSKEEARLSMLEEGLKALSLPSGTVSKWVNQSERTWFDRLMVDEEQRKTKIKKNILDELWQLQFIKWHATMKKSLPKRKEWLESHRKKANELRPILYSIH